MGGDGQNRNVIAVAVEKAVNQMQVARPAGACADRQFAGKLRFRPGGEGGHFFMARGHPVDGPHTVQAVA